MLSSAALIYCRLSLQRVAQLRSFTQRMSTYEWPIIGIDLGTTYSCVAIWKSENQRVEIIENESGTRTTPSMVAFTEHERFVGVPAMNQASGNPENTVYDSKRLIGRKYSDAHIENNIKLWPFKVVSGTEDRPLYDVEFKAERKQFSAEQISGMVLSHMKQLAEVYLGHSVTNAVVTVPAYFNDSQRCATINAARIVGLNVVRIINEPTAVALAYGLEKINSGDVRKRTVLIFDLGGGTLDVTLLEIERGGIVVKAKSGNNYLGGQDFDSRLMEHLANEFKLKCKADISNIPRALQRLKRKCEEVKRMLSTTIEQVVFIDALHNGLDLNTKITRAKFEYLNRDLFDKCINIVGSCLKDACIESNFIDDVVLVGGSSRIPKIQALLREFLNVNSFCQSINPDEAVAYGAAIQAAILGGQRGRLVQNIVLQDSTPLSLGIRNAYDGTVAVIVPRNTTIPITEKSERVTVYDNQESAVFTIFEGERAMAADNHFLGEFTVYDLPRAPAGEVEFDITFHIDSNSVLTVTAIEKKTGKTGKITMHHDRGRLTKEEIDRMILESERYSQEDEMRRQVSFAKDALDSCAYELEKVIENQLSSSKLDDETKKQIQQEVREAIKWSQENEYKAQPSDYHHKKNSLETLAELLTAGLNAAAAFFGRKTAGSGLLTL